MQERLARVRWVAHFVIHSVPIHSVLIWVLGPPALPPRCVVTCPCVCVPAARLTALVNHLFGESLATALAEAVPIHTRSIGTAVQLTADLRMVLGGCTELEQGIREHLDAELTVDRAVLTGHSHPGAQLAKRLGKDQRPLGPARRALELLAGESEDLIMQQVLPPPAPPRPRCRSKN